MLCLCFARAFLYQFFYVLLDGALPPTPDPLSTTTAVKVLIDQFVQAPIFTVVIFGVSVSGLVAIFPISDEQRSAAAVLYCVRRIFSAACFASSLSSLILDLHANLRGALRAIIVQVSIFRGSIPPNGSLHSPYDPPLPCLFYLQVLGLLEGKAVADIREQLDQDYKSTMLANWGVFVPAAVVNLAFCPPELRVLFLNVSLLLPELFFLLLGCVVVF